MTPTAAVSAGPRPTSLCPWPQRGLVSCGWGYGRDALTLGEWQVVEGGREELTVLSLFLPLPEPGRRSAGQRPRQESCPLCPTPGGPLSGQGSSALLSELAFSLSGWRRPAAPRALPSLSEGRKQDLTCPADCPRVLRFDSLCSYPIPY